MNEINVLIGPVSEGDKSLFFGPILPGDEFEQFDSATDFPLLLTVLGVFSSKSDARRNGWNKPIPFGWSDFRIGKKKTRICVLKLPLDGWAEFDRMTARE